MIPAATMTLSDAFEGIAELSFRRPIAADYILIGRVPRPGDHRLVARWANLLSDQPRDVLAKMSDRDFIALAITIDRILNT